MSNRFVSGGTINASGEVAPEPDAAPRAQLAKSTEWEAVQQELENDRKRREEQRLKAATGEERSLYDVLQANKAAKQAAFEEQNKIRNQFRALDDDEVDFLDEVVAAKRMEEERVRRETQDGVRAFREQQRRSSGGGVVVEGEVEGEAEHWAVGRKRKRREREKDKERAVVRKKANGEAGGAGETVAEVDEDGKAKPAEKAEKTEKTEKVPVEVQKEAVRKPEKKSALVDYGSDSDE